ncbi:hypothetical protein UFOVP1212_3 [uncultured Caudovirales phage]|uniref:Uncharacterized protein n=1 Tax=uncultured Caudovirales phage TaxID=2100421 RepID=A0A6J5RC00_9CAUD|nr:hypothetical protein UFOVP1212_3 [uncultured Caudovirales phage]
MFTTVNNVREYTNKDVTVDLIKRAQSIVEIYVGRSEIDIDRTDDLILLEKMTAYQAAYMLNNEDVIYDQIASMSVGSGDTAQNFDTKMSSPWMAPLAVLAARGLSFNRGRSIKTGKIFQWNRKVDWRTM